MTNNYLTLDDVLGIHQDSIEAFGGSHGIRDQGGLEAPVMRPNSGYYPDVISEAASWHERQLAAAGSVGSLPLRNALG